MSTVEQDQGKSFIPSALEIKAGQPKHRQPYGRIVLSMRTQSNHKVRSYATQRRAQIRGESDQLAVTVGVLIDDFERLNVGS
jgi:hypothetical protein